MMRECLDDLWQRRGRCGLRSVAYSIGWFGAIYRSVAILALAIAIAPLPDDDIYVTFYTILLAYSFISLAANFLFIVGISKSYHHYLLPYLGIHGIEILAGIGGTIVGIVFFIRLDLIIVLSYFIPCALVALCIYAYFWSLLVRFYNDLKSTDEDYTSIKLHFCRYVRCRCSCSCFKRHSLDIAT